MQGSPLLEDLMDGLIYIAEADGEMSFQERRFLIRVNALFGLPRRQFRQKINFNNDKDNFDPYKVCGSQKGNAIIRNQTHMAKSGAKKSS